MSRRDPLTIAVLMFDQAPLFETSVPISVFGADRSDMGVPRFDLRAVGGDPGPLTTTGGIRLTAPYGLDALADAATVVVPSWRGPAQRPPEPALAALRDAHADGATVVGLCRGAFVLAAAGLLNGRRAATHWLYAPALAAAYPDVQVDASVLFVDDGDLITSAGTAAGIDACLHLVRRRFGAQVANTIARRMVVPPQRSGGQAQYIEHPLPDPDTNDPLGEILSHAIHHLDDPDLDVDSLAGHALMSRRSFDRRFRELTGTSPLQWLLTQRIMRAQRLLETTDLSVDAIARNVGFTNGIALRPHFRRILGVAPQTYRDTFHARTA
ncbi:helix-turn-helix domain-containing protein [Microbispora catharanthi]|uniref:Helix-turn-helix domain-containing protein n=1 Tax=Microbispora catharanthi TaxID=1712871 RepID=A0A5N6BJT6_9ACTN|nr:helix-turn-helix domain-containing protein [Microbispora catharanthi]KAB8180836.1 helix-turn-helix domain-containing protein [Microbispora catharanthi]